RLNSRKQNCMEDETVNILTSKGHEPAGNRLDADEKNHKRIEEIPARNELDGIGDDFTADQGGAHAFRAHGDAVRDRNCVELQRSSAGGANSFLHMLSELTGVIVAGTNLYTGVGHADKRLLEVIVIET